MGVQREGGREGQSGGLVEPELRGKYALSMERGALIADIKVIVSSFFSGVRPANSARMTKATISMN